MDPAHDKESDQQQYRDKQADHRRAQVVAHRLVQHHRIPANQSRLHPAEPEAVRLYLRCGGRVRRHGCLPLLPGDVRCRTIANRRFPDDSQTTQKAQI